MAVVVPKTGFAIAAALAAAKSAESLLQSLAPGLFSKYDAWRDSVVQSVLQQAASAFILQSASYSGPTNTQTLRASTSSPDKRNTHNGTPFVVPFDQDVTVNWSLDAHALFQIFNVGDSIGADVYIIGKDGVAFHKGAEGQPYTFGYPGDSTDSNSATVPLTAGSYVLVALAGQLSSATVAAQVQYPKNGTPTPLGGGGGIPRWLWYAAGGSALLAGLGLVLPELRHD